MANLLSLPDELLWAIVLELKHEGTVLSIVKTNRKLFSLAIHHLYHLNAQAALLMTEEKHAAYEDQQGQENDMSDDDSDGTLDSIGDLCDDLGAHELCGLNHQAIYWALEQDRLDTLKRAQAAGVATNDLRLVRLSVSTGNTVFLEHLVRNGNGHHLTGRGGSRLIEIACHNANVDVVKKLFELGATISSQPWRSICAAAKAYYEEEDDCRELISLLIRHGADVDATSDDTTALLLAVYASSPAACRVLLEHGADPTRGDITGWPPLAAAVGTFHASISERIRNAKLNVVDVLLGAGVDVSVRTSDQNLPLIVAIEEHAPLSVVKKLVEHGADINKANRQGSTPLLAAAARGESSVTRFLVDHGAEIDSDAECGCAPLAHACEAGDAGSIQVLLNHGADITKVNRNGNTSLHLVADSGNHGAAETVIAHWSRLPTRDESAETKLPVDQRDIFGRTALFYAARAGVNSVVRLLLDAGASVDIRDGFGATAIFAAARNGHTQAVRTLLTAYPAGIDDVDVFGRKLIDWACESGPTDLIELVNEYRGKPVITEMPAHFYNCPWYEFKASPESCAICMRYIEQEQSCWTCPHCLYLTLGREYLVCQPCSDLAQSMGVSRCLDRRRVYEPGEWRNAISPPRGCYLTKEVRRHSTQPCSDGL